jgi:hypothetical protein
MPYKPKSYDVPFKKATEQALQAHAMGVQRIFLEWTCGRCGERVQIELPKANDTLAFYEWLNHEEKEDGSGCGYRIHAPSCKFTVIGITALR